MSTTNKKIQDDSQQDKSSILSLLESIEVIYNTCQQVLNTHTQTALLLSITIEAQMLLTKLRIMKSRWTYHLPFKEACNVDFYDWTKRVENMCQSFDFFRREGLKTVPLPEYCPSKHYLLDLCEMLPEMVGISSYRSYYENTDVKTLVETQDSIQMQLRKQWVDYKEIFSDMIAKQVNELVGGVMPPLTEKGIAVHMACREVLRQLSLELNQLDEMSSAYIKSDQFTRLAERVIIESEYGGEKAEKAARHYVRNLKNITPVEEWDARREEEISASIEQINGMKYGRRVSSYLAHDHELQGHYAGFGRFLYSFRREISKDELYDLMVQLYRIHYFRADRRRREADLSVNPVMSPALPVQRQSASPSSAPQMPQRPLLPVYFDKELSGDTSAIMRFYDILHHCGAYVGRKLTPAERNDVNLRHYARWHWNHVRMAMIRLGIISDETPKLHFARYLTEVFPWLKVDNLTRGFQRHGETASGFDSIVAEVMDEFRNLRE